MLYLRYAPLEPARWTVNRDHVNIAEVKIHPNGVCSLKGLRPTGEVDLDEVDAIGVFMREVAPHAKQ